MLDQVQKWSKKRKVDAAMNAGSSLSNQAGCRFARGKKRDRGRARNTIEGLRRGDMKPWSNWTK